MWHVACSFIENCGPRTLVRWVLKQHMLRCLDALLTTKRAAGDVPERCRRWNNVVPDIRYSAGDGIMWCRSRRLSPKSGIRRWIGKKVGKRKGGEAIQDGIDGGTMEEGTGAL